MPTLVTVNTTTGTFPIDIWVCNDCTTGGTNICQYINTVSVLPYTFTLPTIYESAQNYSIKFIDDNGCEVCDVYSYYYTFQNDGVFFFMDGTPYEFQ